MLIPRLEVKRIVSHHSGTILADPEPERPEALSDEWLAKVQAAFRAQADADGLLSKSKLPALLVGLGSPADASKLSLIIDKLSPNAPERMTEEAVVSLFAAFLAPAFSRGQHMRMFAWRGCVAEMSELIARLCDLNSGDGEGLTALHHACEFNRPEVVDGLLAALPKGQQLAVNATDKYGWTPLHCAAHYGSAACVKKLLGLSADPSLRNIQGKTPLHLAAAQNRGAIVTLLLQAMPSLLGQTDHQHMSALHEAAYRGHLALFQDLSKLAAPEQLQAKDRLGRCPADYLVLN